MPPTPSPGPRPLLKTPLRRAALRVAGPGRRSARASLPPQRSLYPGLSDPRRAAENLATLTPHRGAMEPCRAQQTEGPAPCTAQQAGRGKDQDEGRRQAKSWWSGPCWKGPETYSPLSQLKGETHRHLGTRDSHALGSPVHGRGQSMLSPLRNDSSISPAAGKLWPTQPGTSAPRLCKSALESVKERGLRHKSQPVGVWQLGTGSV